MSGKADEIERSFLVAAEALHHAVVAKDSDTADHSRRCARLCEAVGEELGFRDADLRDVHLAGALHDIGKIALPEDLLKKEGPLTGEEWEVVQVHPEKGAQLLAAVPSLNQVAELVRASHERVDGSGYPLGLAGEETPMGARIVAVCDAYCAMTEERPYRPQRPDEEALGELATWSGSQFDPQVVEAFLRVAERRPDLCARAECGQEQWRPRKPGWLQRLMVMIAPSDARL